MNEKETYGPEDIERLLTEKSFEELYPNEREYVLRHMDSEQEYAQMRRLVLELHAGPADDLDFSAPGRMKEDLLAAHEEAHRRPGFVIWLNSFFTPPTTDASFFRIPAFQVAMVAAVAIIGFAVLRTPEVSKDLAVVQEKEQQTEKPRSLGDSEHSSAEAKKTERSAPSPQLENKAEDMVEDAVGLTAPAGDVIADDRQLDMELSPDALDDASAFIAEEPVILTDEESEEIRDQYQFTAAEPADEVAAEVDVDIDSGDLLERESRSRSDGSLAGAVEDGVFSSDKDDNALGKAAAAQEKNESTSTQSTTTAGYVSTETAEDVAGNEMRRADETAASPTQATSEMLEYLYTCY